MPEQTYLFVYGTLRQAVNHSMHRILAQHAIFRGKATFQGRLYNLGRYPGAVASANSTDRVVGETYRVEYPEKVFAELDEYEGERFRRERVLIRLAGGREIMAWSYLYIGPTEAGSLIPSGDYVVFLNHP